MNRSISESAVAGVPVSLVHGPVHNGDSSLQHYRGRAFLRVSEVAAITDTDPRTVRRGIELGQIPGIHVGENTIRIPAAPFWRLAGLDPNTLEARPQAVDETKGTPAA